MMVRRFILSVAMVALGATVASGQNRPVSAATCDLPHASGVSSQQLTSGERQRAYRLFVPPGYDGRQRLPLVLDLHGSGGNAAGQARTSGLETLSTGERFIVATLEGQGNRWNVPVQDGRADDERQDQGRPAKGERAALRGRAALRSRSTHARAAGVVVAVAGNLGRFRATAHGPHTGEQHCQHARPHQLRIQLHRPALSIIKKRAPGRSLSETVFIVGQGPARRGDEWEHYTGFRGVPARPEEGRAKPANFGWRRPGSGSRSPLTDRPSADDHSPASAERRRSACVR